MLKTFYSSQEFLECGSVSKTCKCRCIYLLQSSVARQERIHLYAVLSLVHSSGRRVPCHRSGSETDGWGLVAEGVERDLARSDPEHRSVACTDLKVT